MKLLRNRVRMLQLEHEKAQKKIQETAKKTTELINLRKRNDERFMRVSNLFNRAKFKFQAVTGLKMSVSILVL